MRAHRRRRVDAPDKSKQLASWRINPERSMPTWSPEKKTAAKLEEILDDSLPTRSHLPRVCAWHGLGAEAAGRVSGRRMHTATEERLALGRPPRSPPSGGRARHGARYGRGPRTMGT